MFRRFKEIWYGAFFGIGTILIDANMHSRMSDRSFVDELTELRGEMVFYRLLFLSFGLALGWLLWRNNRREREFRELQDRFARFQHQLSPLLTVTYSRLQMALTHPESTVLSSEISKHLQTAHEDIRRLKTMIESEERENAK